MMDKIMRLLRELNHEEKVNLLHSIMDKILCEKTLEDYQSECKNYDYPPEVMALLENAVLTKDGEVSRKIKYNITNGTVVDVHMFCFPDDYNGYSVNINEEMLFTCDSEYHIEPLEADQIIMTTIGMPTEHRVPFHKVFWGLLSKHSPNSTAFWYDKLIDGELNTEE